MLEIIEEVIDTEKSAEELVAAAREEVQRNQSEFDREERDRLQKAKMAADALVLDRLADIRNEAENGYHTRIADARSRVQQYLQDSAKMIADVVGEAEKQVLQTSLR